MSPIYLFLVSKAARQFGIKAVFSRAVHLQMHGPGLFEAKRPHLLSDPMQ